ncbi:hypothetical protein RH915_06465 [Serpentinicella sp. ANB-PHB4]|uniref:hypothetical protein n=1 Tax=Serpentinicella sp. ANB-PHB4 TaxID=3074076 RepID=UPI0028563866|nr:hypothetical protein [Serpentinicella sp. ANB-PHB4]MDR5659127.1 hypothetical protein [Serpentinicella sp. ANB-PHB4]
MDVYNTQLIRNIKLDIAAQLKHNILSECEGILERTEINVELNLKKGFGDFSTNAALRLSRQVGINPEKFAKKIIKGMTLKEVDIDKIEIVSPGFINFHLKPNWKLKALEAIQNLESWSNNPAIPAVKYVLKRIDWVLEVLGNDGFEPDISVINLEEAVPADLEVINILINGLDEVESGGTISLNSKNILLENFEIYHDNLSLRKLNQTRLNIVLNIFLATKKLLQA